MQKKLDKWKRWLDRIEEEITELFVIREIFYEVQRMVEENPRIQKPSSFYSFLAKGYTAAAAMGVRRQLKCDGTSISFLRLMNEIIENPTLLSREHFVGLGEAENAELLNRVFDRHADKSGKYVDVHRMKSDRDGLKQKGKKCETFADRYIAHLDKRGMPGIPSFAELDTCIDFLGELLKRYVLLLRADTLLSVLPTYQYDWKAIFREPWMPEGKS